MPRTKWTLKRLPLDNNNHWQLLTVVWLCFLVLAVGGLAYLAVDAVMGGHALYLYHTEGVDDSKSHVIELLVPGDENQKVKKDVPLKPDFLYKPASSRDFSPPPRVVEFYAPWCPHCQHYAPRYKQLASEIAAIHPEIQFYAISCVAHKDLCKAQDVHGYPTVKFFPEGSYDMVKNTNKATHNNVNSILEALGYNEGTKNVGVTAKRNPMLSQQVHENEVKVKTNNKVAETKDKEIARVVPFRVHDVHDAWSDAALSFEFALKNGIYMENGALPEPKRAAFKEWLELLSKTLPSQMGRTHNIINAILKHFSEAMESQSKLDELVDEHRPSDPTWNWQTCTYGDNAMGYTCGLWQLFHVMSVGVVEYNTHNKNPPIPTRHASETLRNYIEHFFQCDVCRMNFLSMYDTCAFDGCHRLSENPSLVEREWRELPLWLWETHNDVNVRLFGERLEQNHDVAANQWESQQARWPALFACPNCWREDRSWEEEQVFNYLHSLYWMGNPTYLKIPSSDSSIGNVSGGGGSGSRGMPLRWKVSAIIFVVGAILARLSSSQKVRRYSGKHKK